MSVSQSQTLFSEATRYIPGGVNSPVRAFKSVEGSPIFIESAKGAYLTDVDGKSYIDYVGSWGPMILGHADPDVVEAVQAAASRGLSFGAPCALEVALAKKITELMPAIEKVRMVSSGTEATMTAIRLARGFTGRSKIIKFEGCYHGHSDSLLVKAGSGILTLGIPSSKGVPEEFASLTLTANYNDAASVQALLEANEGEVACVIVEPVAGNMNCIPPEAGFLSGLRKLCNEHGSLLIIDEVMTGFRVAMGGATALYDIKPDLTCLGKIVGGGMPVAALGGRADVMDKLAPVGDVYQAGTLSGNPLGMAAGLATLSKMAAIPHFHETLATRTTELMTGLQERAAHYGIPFITQQVGAMFGIFFTEQSKISNYAQVMACDAKRFNCFFHQMLARGIYLAPSAFEAGFFSWRHEAIEIEATLKAAEQVFKIMMGELL